MARRGRCRCGLLLQFQKGPDGYKTRCPSCGSVVRLRPLRARSAAKKRRPRNRRSRREPASELPAMSGPAAAPGTAERTVTCEVCYALVPAQASHCPDCGAALDVTVAAEALDGGYSSPHDVALARPWLSSHRFGWWLAGAALVVVVFVLILLQRH